MANMERLAANLEQRGYAVSRFATAQEAADYLDSQIDGCTVGFGGSVTLRDMALQPRLATHNETFWHWDKGTLAQAASAEVYLSSANGVAETGEIINIDGTCNRVSSILFGHKRVYLVVGANKVAPDYEKALWRARNVAAPKNAQRLHKHTPCAAKGDRCYDCQSPERICRGLVVLWEVPESVEHMEIVLVDQDLGY